MGAGHEGQGSVTVRQLLNGGDDLVHDGEQNLITGGLKHEGMGIVVDVLGSAGEVDELADGLELGITLYLVLEEILDGFDVMVGYGFAALDVLGVLEGEIIHDGVDEGHGLGGEGGDFRNTAAGGEMLEPRELDADAEAHQTVLGENILKITDLGGVTAI